MASDDFRVYILDEVTSDLDILSRERLLGWLKDQSSLNGATIIYSTHILDGMNEWATRLLYLETGRIEKDILISSQTPVFLQVREWMLEGISCCGKSR